VFLRWRVCVDSPPLFVELNGQNIVNGCFKKRHETIVETTKMYIFAARKQPKKMVMNYREETITIRKPSKELKEIVETLRKRKVQKLERMREQSSPIFHCDL